MLTQIDLSALADFLIEEVDCSADYEEDDFAFSFRGYRCYCERKRTHFEIHIEGRQHQLPRFIN